MDGSGRLFIGGLHGWSHLFTCTLITLIILQKESVVGNRITRITSPPVILKQPPTDQILFQVAVRVDANDKPFKIECEADGYPEPNYRWTKNGKEFHWEAYDDRIAQEPGKGTLIITSPRDDDVGQYQCYAMNEFGIATSTSVFVRKIELNLFGGGGNAVDRIEAEEGRPFKLSCGDPKGWPKPRLGWVLYSKDGGLKMINSTRIAVDPEGTLWFSNVTTADKSTDFSYACISYSRYRRGYKIEKRVSLSLTPTKSSFLQKNTQPTIQFVSRRNTVAVRGDDLELWCIVGGTPVPDISWTKKGGRLPHDRLKFENYQKTLRIRNVEYSDEGSYECGACNGLGKPVSYTVQVSVNAAPYFTREPEVLIHVAEEETVVIVCEAHGRPAPTIKWIHNGKPIEESPPNLRRQLDGNKLILRNVMEMDTGNYGCNATNTLGYVYKDVAVNVLYMFPEMLELRETETVTIEGRSALLTCRAFGAAKPFIKWFRKSDITRELSGGRYKIFPNGDLEIQTVGLSDAGQYTCLADNKFGNSIRSGTLVVIKNGTKIIEGPESKEVAVGNPVTFRCTANTDLTLTLQIEWLKDGELIEFDPRYVKLGDNSLSIAEMTELDSGTYTCLAKTEFDNVTADANLIVQDVPNPPQLLGIECGNQDATLEWMQTGDNRSPILHYVIQFNTSFTPDAWEVAYNGVPATENRFKISLSPWANYTFRVIAENRIGHSQPSAHSEVCTTPEDVPFKNPDNVKGDKTAASNLRITWTPMSEFDHNAPGFKYEVFWRPEAEANGLAWNTKVISDWKANELIIPNQPLYSPYLIKVRAVNEKGQSNVAPMEFLGYSGQGIPTQAPSNVTLLQKTSPTSAQLSWDPVLAESLQGKFEGYRIESWTEDDEVDAYRTTLIGNNVTSVIVENLKPFSRNFVRVSAYNTYYNGPYSPDLEVTTDEGVPGPVEKLEIRKLGTSSLYLIWEKPKQTNGILTGFRIKYVPINQSQLMENETKVKVPDIDHPNITRAKLGGLEPNTTYRVSIAALTSAGPGRDSIVDAQTNADEVLAKPNFVLTHKESSGSLEAVRVTWQPNFDSDGGERPGSNFFVQYKKRFEVKWNSGTEIIHEDFDIIHGLYPGTYVFRVVSIDGTRRRESDEQKIIIGSPADWPTSTSISDWSTSTFISDWSTSTSISDWSTSTLDTPKQEVIPTAEEGEIDLTGILYVRE